MAIVIAVVEGATGGFGMYQVGERNTVEGIETLDDYKLACEENDYSMEVADDVDGKVYGQDGATIYRLTHNGGEEALNTLEAVWVETAA